MTRAASAPRLLIVAALGRADILSMFDGLIGRAEMTFVEYERNWGHGLDDALYAHYGQLTIWEEHRSAKSLLDSLRPDLVAMLAIGSRNQIALRAEARRRAIEVVHVEHGYRLPVAVREDADLGAPRRSGPRGTIRTNRFFACSALELGVGGLALLEAGVRATVSRTAIADPRLAVARTADRYVSFSPECFEYHRVVDRLPDDLAARTEYVGVPQFDRFDGAGTHRAPDSELAVMADHQLHNAGIRGWSEDYRRRWAEELVEVLSSASRRLVVKRHPGDRDDVWAGCDPSVVTVVDTIEELAEWSRRASLVLGTGSTLQLPLVASPEAAAITLEIHPAPGPALSGRLVECGVAEAAETHAELRAMLDRAGELLDRQRPRKPDFVERFLHRLDGRAGERMATALLRSV